MNRAAYNSQAPVSNCTPRAMAMAGVPLDAAIMFHAKLRNTGPRTRAEWAVFECVRRLVARSPTLAPA